MAKLEENSFQLPSFSFNENRSEVPEKATNSPESFDPLVYCRTCANMDSSLVPIFKGEGADHQLNKKIEKYLPIQVSQDDDLPIQLCCHCASTLLAWDSLILGCVEAEKRLRDLKNSLENKQHLEVKDEETDDSSCLMNASDGVDSDDEPLITKKLSIRKGVKRKAARKRDVLQEKTDLQKPAESDLNQIKRTAKEVTSPKKSVKDVTDPEETKEKCRICGKLVKFLDRHLKNHREEAEETENPAYKCPICRKTFKDTEIFCEDLYSHLNVPETEEDAENTCRVCKQTVAENLAGHVLLHVDVKKPAPAKRKKRKEEGSKSTCEICGKTISRKYTMKRHLATHSGEKRYTCHHCGKQYAQESGLQRHVSVIHEGVRKYKCPICSSVFGSNSELKSHQDTHTDPRPFQCDQCGRTFISQKHLYHHRKYHHTANGLRQLCKLCNKYFSSPSVLKRHHKVVHLGLKEFQCHVCSAQLSTKQYLQEHLRIHTDERPEVCSYCGKTFQMTGNLRQHMKTHMEKTQICYVCGKGFTRRCHLLTHMGSHRGLEQPQCEHCNQAFLLKTDLEKHIKNEHSFKDGEEYAEIIKNEVLS